MVRMLGMLVGLILLGVSPVFAQTPSYDCNDAGPFVVTSAKPYTAQWCTNKTNVAPDGTTVPEIIDGYYVSVDGAQRVDIGRPTQIATNATGKDAWSVVMPSGVSKGQHTFTVIPYNFVRDDNGNPTTTRQEGKPVTAPFSAVDPIYNLPPQPVVGPRIIR